MLEAYGYPDALHLVPGKLEKPVELELLGEREERAGQVEWAEQEEREQ
jgi:hypothetical protein